MIEDENFLHLNAFHCHDGMGYMKELEAIFSSLNFLKRFYLLNLERAYMQDGGTEGEGKGQTSS